MGLMRGIRKNVKAIYWVITISVVVTFVFWGTRTVTLGGRRYAGIVFDEKVSLKEFRLQWIAAQGRAMTPEQVEALTWQRIVELREADRWGIIVPMSEVREAIRNIFSRQGYFDEEAYHDYLDSRRLTEQEFAEIVRDDMRMSQLERLVFAAVPVAPQELRERYNYDKEQRKIKFHMVEVNSLLPAFDVQVEAEQYYLGHTDEFREASKVAVQYIMIEKEPFQAKVTLSDEELRNYYEENKSSYRGADGKAAEFDEVKPQIERVLKAQKADEMARQQAEELFNFGDASEMREVAEKNGLPLVETGLIPEVGPLGESPGSTLWLGEEPEFRKAAFSTPVGGLSSIIETGLGYCILSPLRLVAARVPPFEEVRKIAAEKLRDRRLREAVRYAGIPPEQVEAFLKDQSVLPADVDVTYEEASRYYDSRKNEFMKPKRVKVQYLTVEKAPFEKDVKVTEKEIKEEYGNSQFRYKDEKGNVKPLQEVRESIEKELRTRKAGEMARKRADEIFAIYRPQRMKEQALKYGLELRHSRLFAQGEKIDDYLGDSAAFAREAFQTKPGEVSATFSTDIGYCILSPIQVVDEGVPDFEEVSEQVAEKARTNKAETLANRIAWELYRQVQEKMTREKKDFQTACDQLGLKAEESGYFRRSDSEIEKVGETLGYTRQVFETEPGSLGTPKRIPKGSFLYVVSEVKPPSDEEFAKDSDSYHDALTREKGQQAFQEWMMALFQEANVRRNIPVARRKAAE